MKLLAVVSIFAGINLVYGVYYTSNIFIFRLLQFEKSTYFHKFLETLSKIEPEPAGFLKGFSEERKAVFNVKSTLYISHPINALMCIKRWVRFREVLSQLGYTDGLYELKRTLYGRQLKLPRNDDLQEAYKGLLRLQITYNLTTEMLAAGTILHMVPVTNLQTDDWFALAKLASEQSSQTFLKVAKSWYEFIKNQTFTSKELDIAYRELVQVCYKLDDTECLSIYVQQLHLNDLKDFSWQTAKDYIEASPEPDNDKDSDKLPDFVSESMMKLCHESLQKQLWLATSEDPPSRFNCLYECTHVPYLCFKVELLCTDPPVKRYLDFLSEGEITSVMKLARMLGYEVSSDNETVSSERVSSNTWVTECASPTIRKISRRIADVTNLDTFHELQCSGQSDEKEISNADILRLQSEPFQVVNYGIGGQYKEHLDYYDSLSEDDDDPYNLLVRTRNRMATFLMYISYVEAGGSTIFPRLNLSVAPVKGSAIFWYNTHSSGQYDERVRHGSCPILYGDKWIINKWIGNTGQEFKRLCSLHQDS